MSESKSQTSCDEFLKSCKVTPLEKTFYLRGKVVRGFGRGSKLLGFPTANLDPKAFAKEMDGVPRGVYVGFASVKREDSSKQSDSEKGVFQTMVSLGTAPQFSDHVEDTVEAYICHTYTGDFYDEELSLILCGHIRPMVAFNSLDDLIKAINNDVNLGKEALSSEPLIKYQTDDFFNQ